MWLYRLTVIYLALPLLIFCAGWLRPAWALFASLVLVVGAGYAIRYIDRDAKFKAAVAGWSQLLTRRSVLLMVAGSLLLVAISGAGGYGFQHSDWEKHEIILQDLVDYSWPVYYDYYGEQVGMVYYIAYYLPAALIGKVGGFLLANHVLFLWTWAGLMLAVLWFALCANRSPHFALLVFTLFSGLSAVGIVLRFYLDLPILGAGTDITTEMGRFHFATWMPDWQYNPPILGLFVTPQHALPGWIIMGVILFVMMTHATRKALVFVWVLSALWSPFILLGLAPFLFADLLFRPHTRFCERVANYLSPASAAGLAIGLLIVVYLATKVEPIAAAIQPDLHIGGAFPTLGEWDHPVHYFVAFAVFCLLEFGLYFVLDGYQSFARYPALKSLYLVLLVWLVALPTVRFGKYNDLVMRASIPALFFVAVIVARNGYRLGAGALGRKGFWLGALLLAAVSPTYEIGHQAVRIFQQGRLFQLDVNPERNLVEQYIVDVDLLQQYVSSTDTYFFQQMAQEQNAETSIASNVGILFGDGIALVDLSIDRQEAASGDSLELLLMFRAIEPITQDLSLAVRLVDATGRPIWEEQNWPAGSPTSTWKVGRRLWYDHHTLVVPPDAEPGIYRLEIYFADPQTQVKLPALRITDGAAMGEIVPISFVQVNPATPAPLFPLTPAPHFDEQIALLGSNIPVQTSGVPGTMLIVELTWEALLRPQQDYTGFVQLLDSQGRLVAQHDHPLGGNLVSSSLWAPGLRIADRFEIQLPDEANPGPYRLIVGIYDLMTGVRLPVHLNGQWTGDYVMISELFLAK